MFGTVFRSNMGITVANIHQHEDPEDLFEREPYSVQFQVEGLGKKEFKYQYYY